MPCGGIDKYRDVPVGKCFFCKQENADHYCAEWDCMLHAECILPFLMIPEGRLVIKHGHTVQIWFKEDSNEKIEKAFEQTYNEMQATKTFFKGEEESL